MKIIYLIIFLFTIQQEPMMARKTPSDKNKPATKKAAPAKKPNMLNEVSITATRLAKPSTTTRLYPSGTVRNSQIDSISKANKPLAKMIGKPFGKEGQAKQYGSSQSDMIKAAIKPKKKK